MTNDLKNFLEEEKELPKYPSAVSRRTGEVIQPETHLLSPGEAFMMREAKKQFNLHDTNQ